MEPFVVHSMGKCATRTIAQTLLDHHCMVMHAHRLCHPRDDKEREAASIVDYLWRASVRINVIVPIRMPVRRNISAYFENLGDLTPSTAHFLENYPHEVIMDWFQNELFEYWSYNAFVEPFPKETGFIIYTKMNVRIAIIRLENINDAWAPMLECFGIKNRFSLTAPRGVNNLPAYKGFTVPEAYVTQMHDTEFAKHFYTPTELKNDP